MVVTTPMAIGHTTAQYPSAASHSVPAATAPAPSPAAPTGRTVSSARPAAKLPVGKKLPLPYLAIGIVLLVGISLVIVLSGGKGSSATADGSPVNAAPASASSATTAPAGELFFEPISDAIKTGTVTRHQRSTPPLLDSLACYLSSADNALTWQNGDKTKELPALPGELVYGWKEMANASAALRLQVPQEGPTDIMPQLNVVRIPPSNREHPVLTFCRRNVMTGSRGGSVGRVGLPFDGSLKQAGITVTIAVRCRPVQGLLGRCLRVYSHTKDQNGNGVTRNVLSINVLSSGGFAAVLGNDLL